MYEYFGVTSKSNHLHNKPQQRNTNTIQTETHNKIIKVHTTPVQIKFENIKIAKLKLGFY